MVGDRCAKHMLVPQIITDSLLKGLSPAWLLAGDVAMTGRFQTAHGPLV